MNSHIGIYAVLTILLLPSSSFAQDAQATKALSPEVHISVYDYANVPTELLAAAEAQVHRIFHQAGVETLWRNCSEKVGGGSTNGLPCGWFDLFDSEDPS